MNIVNEYADISGNKKISDSFKLRRKIAVLTFRLQISILAIEGLSRERNVKLIDILKQLGFNYKFDNLEQDLEACLRRRKNDQAALRLALADKETLDKTIKTFTQSDWMDELIELSKFQGYPINEKETSVAKYISVRKKYEEHVEILKKRVKNGQH